LAETTTHRTQAEIAAAHAKAADDLYRALYPDATMPVATRTLAEVGPDRYFSSFARRDAEILQDRLNNRLKRLGVAA